jgi:hypothetical protein
VSATRAARLLVFALVVGVGISQLILTVGDWHLRDMGAYWEAGERLRAGEPLYPPLTDTEASEVYRYAPWFAWVWMPVTLLPRELASVLWSAILLAASAAALWPLVRLRAWLPIALFAPILVGISAIGNVQPLIVAALVLGVERRSGPLWIAAGASLKAVPILFVVTYLGRREWLKTGVAVLLTGLLVGPTLLYDLSHYPAGAGQAAGLFGWPVVYVAAVSAGIVVSLWLARGRFAWLASSATVTLAVPRLFVYDVTLLMTSFASGRRSTARNWVDPAMVVPSEDAIMPGAQPHHEERPGHHE